MSILRVSSVTLCCYWVHTTSKSRHFQSEPQTSQDIANHDNLDQLALTSECPSTVKQALDNGLRDESSKLFGNNDNCPFVNTFASCKTSINDVYIDFIFNSLV